MAGDRGHDMADVEKGTTFSPALFDKASDESPKAYSQTGEPNYDSNAEVHAGYGRRVWDSFKRDPNASATGESSKLEGGFDPHAGAVATANSGLARKLKGRHLQMIAIGGSIGMCSPSCRGMWGNRN